MADDKDIESSPIDLRKILADHNLWLSSPKQGKKAFLSNAFLQEKDLSSANLERAELNCANLRGANLQGAKFKGANLLGTILREANLQDADLKGALGLSSEQLAGTNVSGAYLPDNILKFEGLDNVEKISRNAGKLFTSMLLGCVYAWLTIATTTDARLITNSVSSPLPIVGTQIPIVGFYWAAPLILLSLYFYFHLYLQRLWEALADLPAIFPDGKPLDKKAYPWVLTGLVSVYFLRLQSKRPLLSSLQVGLSILLAWWVVPITQLLFWIRYLCRHDWVGTSFHTIILLISIWAGIMLYHIAATTLSWQEFKAFTWINLWQVKSYKACAIVLGIGAVIYTLTIVSMNNGFQLIRANLREVDLQKANFQKTNLTGADFLYSNLQKANFQQANLEGANLQETNLVEAKLPKANLKEADFGGANLKGADLHDANLERANLRGANLEGANLQNSNLSGADLLDANLKMTKLQGTNFEGSNLMAVDLTDADLKGANMKETNLSNATIFRADLKNATNLTIDQLSKVRTLKNSSFNVEMMNNIEKNHPDLLR